MTQVNFPADFTRKSHPIVSGGIQYTPNFLSPVFLSIIGGGIGLYGDGVNTFEIMIGDKVTGHCTPEEINKLVNEVLALTTY